VLEPAPVGAGAGRGAEDEAVVGVVLVDLRRKLLVPHRIGGHQVEAPQLAVGPAAHAVADLDVRLHVMDEGVHAGHGEGGRVDLLAVESERGDFGRQSAATITGLAVGFQQPKVALDQQPGRAAAGVVDLLAGLRLQDAGHQDGHLARGVDLAGALALALGELPQQVLVGAAEDVRLDVVQAEPMLAEHLDQGGQAGVVDHPLAGGGGVEVDHVDHALEARVLAGHGPGRVAEELAQAGGLLNDPGPASCPG
jgi:hypothetical protein